MRLFTNLFFVIIMTSSITAVETFTVGQDVVVFDVWQYFENENITTIEERADALYFITSLQGIVNRDAPRLYLFAALALFDAETKSYYDKDFRNKPVTEIDKFWFEEFVRKGYFKGRKIKRTTDIKDLLNLAGNKVNGLVLWDMQLPATSNIAMMAAGCENLLPVSTDLGQGKFYKRIKAVAPALKVKLDLTGKFDGKTDVVVNGKTFPSTGSAKNDAYKYAIEKYLRPQIANPYKMWFNCDASMWGKFRNHYAKGTLGYLGDKNELQQNGMYNGDYWVAQKAVFFDLLPWADCKPADDTGQPLGTDNGTWHDILEISYKHRKGEFGLVGGFVPWWLKYTTHTGGKHEPVATEWEFVALLTSYNMGNDGDAAFGIANASFFQHLPAISKEAAAFIEPKAIEYDKETTYLAILMLDYDGSAWLNQMVTSVFNDPARGKIPLNWCVNPVLNERVPHVMKYIYENKTDNDFLGFADDGASYIQPASLTKRKGRIKESGIPYYEKYARDLNERYGIKYNVFYIDDTFDKDWAEMAARITPAGFGYNLPVPDHLVNGTPVNFVKHYHVSEKVKLKNQLDQYYRQSSNNNSGAANLIAMRTILMPPSIIHSVVGEMEEKYPDAKVMFVDVPNFYKLLKHKLSQ